MRNSVRTCSSKTGSRRQSKKKDFEALFIKGILKWKSPAPKLRNLEQITIATLMQPFQYNLRCPAAKKQKYYAHRRGANQPWHSYCSAICTDGVAKCKRNKCNGEIAAPKPNLDAKAKTNTLLRVIPTMAFNSSHLTFCLANLLAFYLANCLRFYLAYLLAFYLYLSVISSDILSGISIWHSIWHIFWHSIWHIFWHSMWHSMWNIFWHSTWHIFWHSIWNIFWHSIWHSI